jgi:anti-sigma-K factor RskA
MTNVSCAQIDERLEELALGEVAEPERSVLLAHVAQCGECRRRLDGVLALTDSLLALAPAIEPPAGFESRVLERLGVDTQPMRTSASDRSRWRVLAVAAAALVVIAAVALGGFAVGRRDQPAAFGSVSAAGSIVRADGTQAGSIRLVAADRSFALVTIARPRASGGSVACRLLLADGQSVAIGSWSYDDVKGGVWAVGIDDSLLSAVGMELVDDEGAVVATATID